MKIAFVNDVHVGKDAVKDGHVRAASSKALEFFPKVLKQIEAHGPELLVNVGDLIRSETTEDDSRNYRLAIACFKHLQVPTIHLIGNHEVKQLKNEHIQTIWDQNNIHQKLFGSKQIKEFNFIWLDFEQEKNEQGIRTTLPQVRLQWLDEELSKSQLPTIILTHYVLTDQNLDGNFYFENFLKVFAEYNNKDEILKILDKHSQKILAVISAHTHGFNYKIHNGIPHITLPAMVENIAASETNDNFPQIYTIIEIVGNKLTVKCFSKQYCYLTLEVDNKL